MDKLPPAAVVERVTEDYETLSYSRNVINQTSEKIRERLGKESPDMDTPMNVTSNGLQTNTANALSNIRGCSADGDIKEEGISAKMDSVFVHDRETSREIEQKNMASKLRELEDYFNVLEENRRNLQHLLQQQREDQEMALRALERRRIQERMEWETLMREREEALRLTFMSVFINREKLLRNLRNQTINLSPLKAVNEAKCSTKHEATGSAGVTLQCASSNSAKHKERDLHKTAVLAEKARMAEIKKQQKALQKAEKAEKKAQNKKGKDKEKKLGSVDDTLPGCSTPCAITESDRKETKKGPSFFGRLFARKKTKTSKPVIEQ